MKSRAEPRRVPSEQLDDVIRTIYSDADRLDWEHLIPARRTDQYDRWITTPEVGGILTAYMTSESARSWIKDGPMKEYGRARRGAGRYARFGQPPGTTPEKVVAHAFGAKFQLIPDSVGIKPFHCSAKSSRETVFVVWGESRNLRHLVWAGISHAADHPQNRVAIVLMESISRPAIMAGGGREKRIAERCGFELHHMRESQNIGTSAEDESV